MYEELQELYVAASELVDKMNKIIDSGEYEAVFTIAYVHGHPYAGETWEKEFNEVQRILAKIDRQLTE